MRNWLTTNVGGLLDDFKIYFASLTSDELGVCNPVFLYNPFR